MKPVWAKGLYFFHIDAFHMLISGIYLSTVFFSYLNYSVKIEDLETFGVQKSDNSSSVAVSILMKGRSPAWKRTWNFMSILSMDERADSILCSGLAVAW